MKRILLAATAALAFGLPSIASADGLNLCKDMFEAYEQGISMCVQAGNESGAVVVSDLFRMQSEDWVRATHEQHGISLPADNEAPLEVGAWYAIDST